MPFDCYYTTIELSGLSIRLHLLFSIYYASSIHIADLQTFILDHQIIFFSINITIFQYFFICNKITNKYYFIMISTTTPLQIRNNPSNTSTSKHHWSFSKAPRFKTPSSNCRQSSYLRKSNITSRSTSFGYGKKTNVFEGQTIVPEPGKYELATDLQKNKKQNKGFRFTDNRQNLKFNNYTQTIEVTPDPSRYQIDENQVKSKKAYSLRPKTCYPRNYFLPNQNQQLEKEQLPGPGKYETIDTCGKFYHTNGTNNHAKSFSKNSRFYNQKQTPGPQDYKDTTIQADGIYLLSNMKGSGKRGFLHGRRNLRLDGNKQTPGPGTYRAPSDFGHYQNQIDLSKKHH